MQQELVSAVISAVGIVFTSMVGYLARYVTAYFADKEIMQELKNKQYLVEIVVNAVEQVYEHENGAEKLRIAKQKVVELAKLNGVKITNQEIDAFIEDVVFAINQGVKDELPKRVEE